MKSIQIRNAKIIDGINEFPNISNVYIENGYIREISIKNKSADLIIDADGKKLVPGFVDAHIHIESTFATPLEFSKVAIKNGTLAVIADPHEIANVMGTDGIDMFLKLAEEALIDVYVAIPSCVPATEFDTNGAGKLTAKDLSKYVTEDRVVSLGEVMSNYDLINGDKDLIEKIKKFSSKKIDGHTAGLSENKLEEYIKAGINNDHESISANTVEQLVQLGATPFIREGSATKNLEDIITGTKDKDILKQCCFCTDDKHLKDLKEFGHINYNVSKSIDLGVDEKIAISMASANAYDHYKIKKKGQVKEGYIANLVLFDDLYKKADIVIKDGMVVVENGELIENLKNKKSQYSEFANTVKVNKVHLKEENWKGKKKCIVLVDKQIVTEISEIDKVEEYNYLAVIERYGKNGNISFSYISNYHICNGAISTTVGHDSHNIIVVGDNVRDMNIAVNALINNHGGYTVVRNGQVTAELPMQFCGEMSVESADEIIKKMDNVMQETDKLQINKNIDPLLTLSFISLPVIPKIRLLDTGLFDVLNRKFLEAQFEKEPRSI